MEQNKPSNTQQAGNIQRVIKDYFGEAPEVYEVAMYAASVLLVNEQVARALINRETEVSGVPPESIALMKRYDDGLVMNDFWAKNYVPIKSQLVLDDVKMNTLTNYIQYFEQKKNTSVLQQARALLLNRLDVLTMIAFYYKGVTFAERFDFEVRASFTLPKDLVDYFTEAGLGD